ncbi:MAG: hypothetical protein K2X01_00510 [Cyanobacteria bacterium]|nr:hypothetical protein [Cyanobacteriota bacterium]
MQNGSQISNTHTNNTYEGYNPSNLASQPNMQEFGNLFDEFTEVVSGELRSNFASQ